MDEDNVKHKEYLQIKEDINNITEKYDQQLFYFNAGIIIICLYGVEKVIDKEELPFYAKYSAFLPIIFCILAIYCLLRTYKIDVEIQKVYLRQNFNKNEYIIPQKLVDKNHLYNKRAWNLTKIGAIAFVLVVLFFMAMLDISKKPANEKLNLITDNMTDKTTNNKTQTPSNNNLPPKKPQGAIVTNSVNLLPPKAPTAKDTTNTK